MPWTNIYYHGKECLFTKHDIAVNATLPRCQDTNPIHASKHAIFDTIRYQLRSFQVYLQILVHIDNTSHLLLML